MIRLKMAKEQTRAFTVVMEGLLFCCRGSGSQSGLGGFVRLGCSVEKAL